MKAKDQGARPRATALRGDVSVSCQFGQTKVTVSALGLQIDSVEQFNPDEKQRHVYRVGNLRATVDIDGVTLEAQFRRTDHQLVATWRRIERHAQNRGGGVLSWRILARFCCDYVGPLNLRGGLDAKTWAGPIDWLCGGWFDSEAEPKGKKLTSPSIKSPGQGAATE